MPFQTTATRIWKRLDPATRLAAATQFWSEPPAEAAGAAMGAIAGARKMRPQAVRGMSAEAKAKALATVLDPGESVAASLLVALHLGHRRAMLAAFLDALGMPHEDGLLKEDAPAAPPPSVEQVRSAAEGLVARFPMGDVEVYLNTLLVQDPDHWQSVSACEDLLVPQPSSRG